MLAAAPIKERRELAGGLRLKLEALQVTGSFKARGAINAVFTLPPEQLRRGIVTASGGNHGLAVAYAGWATGVPATIFLPRSVAADKIAKLDAWGARVVMSGEVWDDSNRAALQHAETEGLAYIHPFADPEVIAGQGTIALEILDEAPDLDTLLVAIGGRRPDLGSRDRGQGAKARHPHYRGRAGGCTDPARQPRGRSPRRARSASTPPR